jgi:UDP-N-acetylglucosamine 1-carboxyvinyltransferase
MRAIINGSPAPLEGRIPINGSKNAALPIMAAALLTTEPIVLHNIPNISDVGVMAELLRSLGATVAFRLSPELANHSMIIHCLDIHEPNVSPKLAGKIRASFFLLAPLLTRMGKVRMPLPGGSDIGVRGIDLHVEALEALGADINPCDGDLDTINARLPRQLDRFDGNTFTFSKVSVGATENLLMAAVLASGVTVIKNAAYEPDVTDLSQFLVKMGARIQGIGSRKLTIHGVERLHGCDHAIIPDRHEAATYALAAIMTDGRIELTGIRKHHFSSISKEFRGIGGKIIDNSKTDSVTVKRRKGGRIKPQSIATDPYPNFPTDMQPQFCAALCLASPSKRTGSSTSILYERVFENRVGHANELVKLGADICCVNVNYDHQILIRGSPRGLIGNCVMATDLRAAAALVLAGLVASGETVVEGIEHLLRGYEAMDMKLNSCGARVQFLK